MKHLLTLLALLAIQVAIAQVNDDFSDGDFSNNPAWSGDTGDFVVSANELQLNAGVAGESHLTIPNTTIDNTIWEFSVKLDFGTSSQNRAYIYLVSDIDNLQANVNGYYVLVGNSSDEISLYRQDATTTSVEIIDGTDATVETPPTNVRIRVTRDALGNWELLRDLSGGTSFTSEGTVFDDTYTSTAFFGVLCDYSVGNIKGFIYDNISIGFAVSTLTLEGTNMIRAKFNQNVHESTAEDVSNYSLNNGFGQPTSAERDLTNHDEVLLTFDSDFSNNSFILSVDQVENASQDEIISNQDKGFKAEVQTPFRNIVINEFMADPNPVVALPDAEYVELYNTSDYSINVAEFTLDGESLTDFILMPDTYVTLTDNSNIGLFSGDVIGLENLSLSNTGKSLLLNDNLGNLVDSVTYKAANVIGGYSLEQINPELLCSTENNWIASNHADGGTPGTQNSVYDNSPDITGPNLIDFIATDPNTFRLTFDEPMDETSLSSGTYTFDNGITENGISSSTYTAQIAVTPTLTSDVNYTVTVTGAKDCAQNDIQTNTLSYTYDTNPPVLDHIVVKTANQIEVVFNENLNKDIAETESNYTSDHSGMHPTSAIRDDVDFSTVSLIFADDFVLDVENTLTIENLQDIPGNALAAALTPTFTLSQQIDTVQVMGINLLDIYFKQDLDVTSASTSGNYSVDDGVGSASTAFVDSQDDRLVHLAFANNFDDNKALTLSVSGVMNADSDLLTTPDISFIYDTSSPKLDTVEVLSSTSLAVVFTEKVGKQSAESKENYEYEDIFPIDASLEADQRTVILEFEEAFEREVVFELLIDEVKDLYGNEIKTRLKQEFVYDVFAPELDSIIVKSPNEIILWFNEKVDQTTAETAANYMIGEGIGQPTTAIQNPEFQYLVTLEFSSDLPEMAAISLAISTMLDQRNNALSKAITSTFDYHIFYVGMINPVSQNQIEIEFNKTPSTGTRATLANYTLNGHTASTVNFTSDRMATVTFDHAVNDNSSNTLNIEHVTQNSNPISINNYVFNFDSRVLTGRLVGNRTVEIEFEIGLDQGQVLSLSNFTASPTLGNCVAAIIDPDDSEKLRLTFEQALAPDVAYKISWQDLFNEFEHRLPDYFSTVINDQTAPSVAEYLVLNEDKIWIKYSEPLNEISAEFSLNYEITPTLGHPFEAKYTASDSSVLLTFSSSLLEATNYTLTIDNIEDLSDNALFDYNIAFSYTAPDIPNFGDLIITEIMADPSPSVGLPEVEYVEIFNTTSEEISLTGLIVVDASGYVILTEGSISANQYLVLTSTSGASQLHGVNVLGISSFPSLNNTGESLSLYYGSSQIFSASYASDWYKDSEKSDGGWSLEMIDTDNPCGEKANWSASTDAIGGTPGRANSIQASNPDNFGPELIQALAITPDSLHLTLNERLHPDSFEQAKIQLEPALSISSQHLFHPIFDKVAVSLGEPVSPGQSYEVTLTQVSDCKQNLISIDHQTVRFQLPEEAEAQDIVINEVLFNPRSNEVDFVEIYNKSDKAIDLKDWRLADKLSDQKIISSDHFVIYPSEYLALTPDPDVLNSAYSNGDYTRMRAMNSFPSLSDTEDSVILITDQGLIVDQMEYKDDYHFNLLDDDEGVSLERVAFEVESTNPDSWRSAASTVGFATPGVVNSQLQAANQSSATVSIEPKVFVPDNTGMNDFTTISYLLNQAGNFANVHIYSSHGVLIKTLAEGELLATNGFFTWDGITDNGSLASVGYYVVVFEIFDGQGNKSLQKETVVLGARF
ncbi:MAG: lamin tail domain-containing protein [Reichenbachiella sp.]|uniref:lamin tail domain-containing protein n=1 Tax=Reichenbachiella sp. TaxID=2184521 RepID=UPI00296769B4|nr:lamin tail domain-containing protein [Reichenbachiella sp.]MDW3212289.1 lamin tail domain-containing protein [Reichenbachiella sp.]